MNVYVLFTEIEKRFDKHRVGLCCLAEFSDSDIEVSLLVRIDAGLHMMSTF